MQIQESVNFLSGALVSTQLQLVTNSEEGEHGGLLDAALLRIDSFW